MTRLYKAIGLRDQTVHPVKTTRLGQSIFNCLPPLNIDFASNKEAFTESRVPHHYALHHEARVPFIAEIKDAQVVSEQGLVFDRENLFADSYHNHELIKTIVPVPPMIGPLTNGSLQANLRHWDWNQKFDKIPVLILSPHSGNYHHWILETLPRFWIFDEAPEYRRLPIILPPLTKQFQIDTLDRILNGTSEVCTHKEGILVLDCLIFPSFLAPGGHSRKQLDWLRSKFLLPSEDKSRLLYISRRDAINGRRVLNEEKLVQRLVGLGFQEVVLTGKSHAEQVGLFASARIIVGASGSGITNHIFAPEGSHVIEFHPKAYTNRAHFFTTNLLDQTYQFVICDQDQIGDMTVPVDEALQCVERVL